MQFIYTTNGHGELLELERESRKLAKEFALETASIKGLHPLDSKGVLVIDSW